jgi:hypothetical protein
VPPSPVITPFQLQSLDEYDPEPISRAGYADITMWQNQVWLPLDHEAAVSIKAPDTRTAATLLLEVILYHTPRDDQEVAVFNIPPGVYCTLGKLEGFLHRNVSIAMSVLFTHTMFDKTLNLCMPAKLILQELVL